MQNGFSEKVIHKVINKKPPIYWLYTGGCNKKNLWTALGEHRFIVSQSTFPENDFHVLVRFFHHTDNVQLLYPFEHIRTVLGVPCI